MDEIQEQLYTAQNVTASALRQALTDARLRWVYAERMEDIVLTACAGWPPDEAPLERWRHGRAFADELELCWWRRGSGRASEHDGVRYDVRAITAGDAPATEAIDWQAQALADWKAAPSQWLLIGEQDTDRESDCPSWSVARIPRYLYYPAPEQETPPERVAVWATAYRHAGITTLHRLLTVKGVETDEL
jgi:hypothetical protein